VEESKPFQLVQTIHRIFLQLLSWNMEVSFQRIDNSLESDSRWATFDSYPDSSGYPIEAVTEASADIEEYGPTILVVGAHVRRNQPSTIVTDIHCSPESVC
jgi:hypothetical protein